MPDLDFQVEHVEAVKFAAVPTLHFRLCVTNLTGEPVRSVALNTQIRIAARERHSSSGEQSGLTDLFGESHRWATTLGSFLWTHATVNVPSFDGRTLVELPVTCTYDFDVVSAKYFHGLDDGEVPLEFLFSGTVFYAVDSGLQVSQISWDKEAQFRMPIQVWKTMMDHYFPNSAWLRLNSDTFNRLNQYRSRSGLPTWDDALERLLGSERRPDPRG